MIIKRYLLVIFLIIMALTLMAVGCSNKNDIQVPENDNEQVTSNGQNSENGDAGANGQKLKEDSLAEDDETEVSEDQADSTSDTERPKESEQVKTVSEIMGLVENSEFIDKSHLDAGLECKSCHGPLPEKGQTPEPPSTEKCLSCHEGSYNELAKLTEEGWEERNPHKSHQGELACSDCHKVHDSFEFICNTCHTWSSGNRFK